MSVQVQNGQARRETRKPITDSQTLDIDNLIQRIAKQPSAPLKSVASARLSPAATPASRPAWAIDGIADNTRITTSFGEVPAQLLRKNDMLRTRDGSFRRIAWISHLRFDEEFMAQHPEAAPIRIRAGALGRNMPERDVELSPSNAISLTTGTGRATFKAKDLLNRSGVLQMPRTLLSYTQIRCEGGDTEICSEGVWIHLNG